MQVADQHKQHEVEFFFSGFKKKAAVIYMQFTLRRPPSQPPAQTTFFFLHENLHVSEAVFTCKDYHYSRGTFHRNALEIASFTPPPFIFFWHESQVLILSKVL